MLGPRLKIRLFDTALALRYTGFEQPTLYAELGGPFYCENGYHFFGSTPHLCVVTGAFLPICLDHIASLIAIPDALVYPAFRLSIPARMDTIGQQVKAGGYYVYPPLCEWEKDPGWRHPEWYKIEQWMKGQNFQDCGQSFWRGLRSYLNRESWLHPMDMEDLGMPSLIPLSAVHNGRIFFFLLVSIFIYLV